MTIVVGEVTSKCFAHLPGLHTNNKPHNHALVAGIPEGEEDSIAVETFVVVVVAAVARPHTAAVVLHRAVVPETVVSEEECNVVACPSRA